MAASKKKCPDCSSTKVEETLASDDVTQFHCDHCGQRWQERDGEIQHKVYAEPPSDDE